MGVQAFEETIVTARRRTPVALTASPRRRRISMRSPLPEMARTLRSGFMTSGGLRCTPVHSPR